MTQAATLSAIKALRGMTARVRDGEYRVTFTAEHIAAIMPHLSAREVQERAEACAAYTDDKADALATAKTMAYNGFRASTVEYVARNAEMARRDTLAGETGRGFDAARPFRVRNKTPQFSGSFDFATLAEAREYLTGQLARRDSVVAGAAPVGPDSNSQDPMQSFIFWADGTETLCDMGWTPPSDGGARWNAPAPAPVATDEPATVEAAPVKLKLSGSAPRRDNVEYHAGRDAWRANATKDSNPYPADGERAARWNLGWQEACDSGVSVRETIDMTPTWAAIAGVFIACLEDGTETGKRAARTEIARMATLADERNAFATRLAGAEQIAREVRGGLSDGPRQAVESILSALRGESPYRFDFDRLSGTGIIVRLSDDLTSLRYTGSDAARLREMSPADLATEAAGVEFS